MNAEFEIVGGAGEPEAAAIGAVIACLLSEEAEVRADPCRPPKPSPWVVAWRPREVPTPLPSHTYEAPRTETEENRGSAE